MLHPEACAALYSCTQYKHAHAAVHAAPAHPVAMTLAPLSCPSCPILAMRMRGRRPAAASNRATAFSTAISSACAGQGQGAGRRQTAGVTCEVWRVPACGPLPSLLPLLLLLLLSLQLAFDLQHRPSAAQHNHSTAQHRPHFCCAAQGLAVHASGHAACRQRSAGCRRSRQCSIPSIQRHVGHSWQRGKQHSAAFNYTVLLTKVC